MSKIPVYVGSKNVTVPALPPALSASACSVNPRPGGFIKSETGNNDKRLPSRSKNLNESLKEKQFTFKKSKYKINECDEMLAVTISCVMMMASNAIDIPDEYFVWTDHYLSRIKDENGKFPPNIKGILNHIALIRPNIPTPETFNCRCGAYQEQNAEASVNPVDPVDAVDPDDNQDE